MLRPRTRRSLYQRLIFSGGRTRLVHSPLLGESQAAGLRALIRGDIRNLANEREPRIYDAANLQRYLLRHWAVEGIAAQGDFTVELANEPGTFSACSNKLPTDEVAPRPFANFNEPCWFEVDQARLADCRDEFTASVFPELPRGADRENAHAAYIEPVAPETFVLDGSMRGTLADRMATGIDRAVAVWLFSELGADISCDGMLWLGVSQAGDWIQTLNFTGSYYSGDPVREGIAMESAVRDLCPFMFGLSVLNSKTGFSMPINESPLMRRIGVRHGDDSPYLFEHDSGPRMRHFVRGHWRTYHKGRSEPLTVWVTPHTRGGRTRLDGG